LELIKWEKEHLFFRAKVLNMWEWLRILFENSVEAKEMIKTADDILGFNLSHIMFNGPEEELKQTRVTQPAIFVHSAVLFSMLRTIEAQGYAGAFVGRIFSFICFWRRSIL
jgi:malonyl CoA-acyl carrier protein transacylase